MRSNRKLSGIALVAVVAGLSLTACNPEDTSASGSASPVSDTAVQNPSSGSGSSSGKSAGSGSSDSGSGSASASTSGSGSTSTSTSGSMCKTSNLTISAHHGMSDEGQEIVNLVNNGSSTCTMHGYPGVDLKSGSGGDTVSATRAKTDTPTIKLAPGEQTDFVLYYPFNNSGGSGFTFTTMIITPPDETHSKSVSASINIPLDNPDQPSDSPSGITVNAVGAGK